MYVKAKLFVMSAFIVFALLSGAYAEASDISCTFNSDKKEVNSPSDVVVISWDVEGADSVYINNGIGYVNSKSSIAIDNIYYDITYTLTAKKGDDIKTCRLTILYKGKNKNLKNKTKTPSCDIQVAPESFSNTTSVVLTWDSSNAYKAELVGYGEVHKKGTKVINNINKTTLFKLIVEGDGGTATCSTVVYKDDIDTIPNPSCEIYTIGKDILKKGESTTLKWKSKHSKSATLFVVNDIELDFKELGSVSLNGELNISPSKTAKYLLMIENDYGKYGYCEKVIEVQDSGISHAFDSFSNFDQNMNKQHTQYNIYGETMYSEVAMATANFLSQITYPTFSTNGMPPIYQNAYRINIASLPYTGPNAAYYVIFNIAVLIASLLSMALLKKKLAF